MGNPRTQGKPLNTAQEDARSANATNKTAAIDQKAYETIFPSTDIQGLDALIAAFDGDRSAALEYLYSLALQRNQNDTEWAMMKWKAEKDSTPNKLREWIDAGGNPNAFFNNGSGVIAAPTGAASGTGGVSHNAGAIMQALQGTRDTMRTGLEASRQYWENENLKQDAKAKEITNTTLGETNQVNIAEAHARIKKMQQDGQLSEAQTRQIDTMLPHMVDKTKSEIGEIKAKTWDLLGVTEEAMARIQNLRQDTAKKLQETLAEKWRNTFRQDMNIDPMSPPITQLIQWLTSKKNTDSAKKTLTEFFAAIGEDTKGLGKQIKADLKELGTTIKSAWQKGRDQEKQKNKGTGYTRSKN